MVRAAPVMGASSLSWAHPGTPVGVHLLTGMPLCAACVAMGVANRAGAPSTGRSVRVHFSACEIVYLCVCLEGEGGCKDTPTHLHTPKHTHAQNA